jgi:hypothetical protein
VNAVSALRVVTTASVVATAVKWTNMCEECLKKMDKEFIPQMDWEKEAIEKYKIKVCSVRCLIDYLGN